MQPVPAKNVRPDYSASLALFVSVSGSIFFGFPRRDLSRDASRLLDLHTPRPIMSGLEHIPREGACLIVANHYQRKGMWIGWPGAMISEAVNSVRPAAPPLRIVVTDAQRMKLLGREINVPLSGWFLSRVASFWQMIPIPGNLSDTSGHAAALRATLTVLRKGSPVLFFPEGERGSADRLIEALPGTGDFIKLASQRAQILPCAFWEEGEQLRGQIAPPLTFITGDDTAIRGQVMAAIGAMLPESMRGPYASTIEHKQTIKQHDGR